METWEAGRDHLLDLLAQGATMREVLSVRRPGISLDTKLGMIP